MDFWTIVFIAAFTGGAVFKWADFGLDRKPGDAGWAAVWTVIAIGMTVATLLTPS